MKLERKRTGFRRGVPALRRLLEQGVQLQLHVVGRRGGQLGDSLASGSEGGRRVEASGRVHSLSAADLGGAWRHCRQRGGLEYPGTSQVRKKRRFAEDRAHGETNSKRMRGIAGNFRIIG